MTLADHEIDNLAGLNSATEVKPLLTQQQKSEVLDPPSPWYAKQSSQILVVSMIVIPTGWLLYTLFSSGGSNTVTVAKTPISQNEQLLKQQLEDEQKARQDSDKAAAFGKQVDIVATNPSQKNKTIKVKSAAVPPRPAPPARYMADGTINRPYSGPPTFRRVVYPNQGPASAPVRRSFVPPEPAMSRAPQRVQPNYPSTVAFTPSIPQEDPEAAWKRLSELGSYAGTGSPIASASTDYTPTAYTPAVYNQPSNSVIESEYVPSAETQPVGGADYQPDASPASMGISIPAGTQAKAELTTPVLWAQDINISDDEFLVKLTQPLGTGLPKGTLVVMKPDKISNAGLVRFKAVRATLNGADHALPDGIEVVSTDGGFIKASQKKPGSGINFSDMFGVLLGGARTATSLINQPTNSSSFSSVSGISQTVTNAQPDILAAFGQGAADTLLNRAQSRVQQVQSTRTPYFLINGGTELKLMVTQSVSI